MQIKLGILNSQTNEYLVFTNGTNNTMEVLERGINLINDWNNVVIILCDV